MKMKLYMVEITIVTFLGEMKFLLKIIVKQKVEYVLILIIIIFHLLENCLEEKSLM